MRNSRFVISVLTLLLKNPKIFLIALLCGGLFYSYEYFIARDTMSFMGVPKDGREVWTRIFRNSAYMVGYSDTRGNPLWVVYKLKSVDKNAYHLKRPDGFSADWRNLGLITSSDYTNSGYDRGHMAPNHAISSLYGKEAQKETFLMTNIVPQKPSLNQKLWQRLEEIELYTFAPKFKDLWVYTGPLFSSKTVRLKSSFWVEVPDAFYKIYVGVGKDGALSTISFIIPQNAKPNDKLEKYVSTIDEAERRSGFDFFHNLEDAIEEKLEAQVLLEPWF
ncbi:MAG: DNA/RNA non-specific endonuclease [Sulfurospirillaceae bacterium]|nr:DNA/RNA non-specific endonuclease [Sulfurospirillaceae bacterium]